MGKKSEERLKASLKRLEEISTSNPSVKERSAWECVLLSRQPNRPGALDYIDYLCDDFMELHGDRNFRDDLAMVGGIGTIDGRAVTFIGNRKGRNLRENIAYNYGMK